MSKPCPAAIGPTIDAMMDLISQDKKVQRGQLTFILVRGIGQAFVTRDVDAGEVRAFLAEKLAHDAMTMSDTIVNLLIAAISCLPPMLFTLPRNSRW